MLRIAHPMGRSSPFPSRKRKKKKKKKKKNFSEGKNITPTQPKKRGGILALSNGGRKAREKKEA